MPVGTQGAVKGVTNRDLKRWAPRSCSATPIICICGRATTSSRAAAGCTGSSAGRGRFSPTAVAIRCSASRRDGRWTRRRAVPIASRRVGASADARESADIQAQLGSDITMVLDECLAHPATADTARQSMAGAALGAARTRPLSRAPRDARIRTSAVRDRAGRCLPGAARRERMRHSRDRLRRLRYRRAERRRAGGRDVRHRLAHDAVSSRRPASIPDGHRHARGSGRIGGARRRPFDCVLPTRNARNGQLFTSEGRINIKNARYAEDDRPPDPACGCYTCRTASACLFAAFIYGGRDQRGNP